MSKARMYWMISLSLSILIAFSRWTWVSRYQNVHGRCNRGVWGDNVPPTFGTSGVQGGTKGRSNENDLCFYSRQSLFSTVQV